MVPVICVGLSHAGTPVEIRERVAFSASHLPDAVAQLRSHEGFLEAVVLSTCNRMEIYAVPGPQNTSPAERIDAWLRRRFSLPGEVHFYVHRGTDAIRHLFTVVSGLDSMVLGETEIFGQVKDAYAISHRSGGTGRILNKLFQESFRAGKAVRNRTEIQRGATSVGAVAVDLAGRIFGDLRESTVMLLGAGEMSRRCAQSLQSRGARGIVVSNRNAERAAELAAEMSGIAVPFDNWATYTADVDVIISSTAAPHTVIHPEDILPAMRRRRGRPLFLIDIAVPRDIDPAVNDIEGVYLYDIDALEAIAGETRQRRERETARCRAIIEDCVASSSLLRLSDSNPEPSLPAARRPIQP